MYEEDNGKKSLREKFNETYDMETIGLEYLEVGLDNICNLTCDGCWAEFSSSWSEKTVSRQAKKFFIYVLAKTLKYCLTHLTKYYF